MKPLSRVQLFATPWTAARQSSLSIAFYCIVIGLIILFTEKTSRNKGNILNLTAQYFEKYSNTVQQLAGEGLSLFKFATWRFACSGLTVFVKMLWSGSVTPGPTQCLNTVSMGEVLWQKQKNWVRKIGPRLTLARLFFFFFIYFY